MHTATFKEIKAGKVTDVYFQRTKEILKKKGIRRRVAVEVTTKSLPEEWSWAVFVGLEECVELLRGLRGVDVWALEEGTLFFPSMPVMVIEGEYTSFGCYETALLGILCQASGVATRAARCKKAAAGRPIVSFGARRMHPAIAPMIERSAFIGGCDGVATVKGAEMAGVAPTGTIPHALVLLTGGAAEAVEAFDDIIDRTVKRIALVDTFSDEKFEALSAAAALGRRLYGIRIDTTPSRRGNLKEILREVRWELDLRGFRQVKIFVSGGIDEKRIEALNEFSDAYGVGTALSNAPTIDFAMDIVSIDDMPVSKKGKLSGVKEVHRCPVCLGTWVTPKGYAPKRRCNHAAPCKKLLRKSIADGTLTKELPHPQTIRKSVLKQLALVSLS
ncbi:MAG: nicotinate phosphoribosyltransferase [Candidatus Omnitrophica bacterium]|nr:nicotinate phosphoribosyltransferase [Candidatus Omnitrophota bacterium]